MSRRHFGAVAAAAAAAVAVAVVTSPALAAPVSFLGVAAGDADSSSAVLWTRATDGTSDPLPLTAQVSTDPAFGSFVTANISTDPANRDSVAKVIAPGLQSGTTYHYRFVGPGNAVSPVGTFKTSPAPTAAVGVRFGFSGDCDGQWRPYASARNLPGKALDAFVFLGDTIYETASGGGGPNASPAAFVPSFTSNAITPADAQQITDSYRRKYREQFGTTAPGGFPGLTSFFAAQGNYTVLDNHELGNNQYINGGAPADAIRNDVDPAKDANPTGANGYINQTLGFKAFVQAYKDYQPIREATVSAPGDARSNGTLQQYRAQQWGQHVQYVQLDDRSYRDVRLKKAGGVDDTGPRADNPNRTMLGATELAWAKQQLSAAQAAGTTWKIVAVSSPIDQVGPIGSGADGGKSWIGGYRAERNALLKYVADNHITNVVFLSTDDHFARANELGYFDDITDQSTYHRLDRVYSIVAGPIGAGGPDAVTDHSFANVQALAATMAGGQAAAGVDPLGLDPASPFVSNVRREGDASANAARSPVDFYSPDTFNYAILTVSPDGRTLDVSVEGIDSYAANTFPEPGATTDVREVFGFTLDAVPEPGSALLAAGAVPLLAGRRRRPAAA